MPMSRSKRLAAASAPMILAASLAGWVLASSASAQTPVQAGPEGTSQSSSVPEVIVTARRRAERLQDVPLAVSAFTSQKLESLGITSQAQLSEFTPGFQFTDYTEGRTTRGAFRSLVFRGLSLTNNTGVTSAGLVFLDGAPVVAGDVLITDSLERVEVLKGPQNVYFGRSTFSGAVNYVTRNPGNTYIGSLNAEVGNYDTGKIDAHFEGPLIRDKLTASLDGEFYTRSGEYTDPAQPDIKYGARRTYSVAGTLYATPTDQLSVKAYLNYYTYDDGPGAQGFIPSTQANCNPGGAPGGAFYQCGTVGSIDHKYLAETLNFTKNESYALGGPAGYKMLLGSYYCNHFGSCADTLAGHVIINYALPYGIKLQSITAYHRRNVDDIANLVQVDASNQPNPLYGNPAYPTAPPFNTFDYAIFNRTTDISTEFRVSSADTQTIRWTLGSNFVSAKDLNQLLFYTGAGAAGPPGPKTTFGSTGAETYGLFGGLYYQPFRPLIISVEGRYQSDGRTDVSGTDGTVFKRTFSSFSPRASIEYRLSDSLNTYASYAEGVRPGGFNAVLSGLPPALLAQIQAQTGVNSTAYLEEHLSTTEFGVKGALFERRVRIDLSGYFGKLTHEQSSSVAFTTAVGAGSSGGEYTIFSNQGTVDISGVEADAEWKVSRMLSLSGTFAYNHTEIVQSDCYTCSLITGSTSINGKRLPAAPEIAFSLAADLTHSLTPTLEGFAHADLAYKGNRYIDQTNLIGTGASTMVDLAAGVRTGAISLEAFVENVTDDQTVTGGTPGLDFTTFSNYGLRLGLPDRRYYGLRLKYNFGR